MTREELIELFNRYSVYNGVADYHMVYRRSKLVDEILELHEEKVKQLAIYLNK